MPKKKISKAQKSGLIFPPSRAEKFLRKYKRRVGSSAPVYFAAVLEYIAAEILELAGNAARDDKKKTISNRHMFMAIENDEELARMLRDLNIKIPNSGVMPNIHQVLLPKKK